MFHYWQNLFTNTTPYDALHFEIDTIRNTMEFLHQLYPDKTKDELERM